MRNEYNKPGEDNKIVLLQTYRKENVLSRTPIWSSRPPKITSFTGKSDVLEVQSSLENKEKHPDATIPKYLNLEPSLAMDWLEISWEELHIKERVGAGTFSFFLLYFILDIFVLS